MYRFFLAVVILAIGIPVGLYNAWLFIDLWKWFVVPLSPENIPVLTVWWAYGLLYVIGWSHMTTLVSLPGNVSDEDIGECFANKIATILAIAVVYTLMWVVAKFIVYPAAF
ncbi:hypothetical protein Xoosp13_107 [Xanthomonas phage Xoo-sp13]|nr:hypothetical protein Xoosp13_107 [Xanthomonas phage Xoo-sp13]